METRPATDQDRIALETDLRLAAHLRALSHVSLATDHDIRSPLHIMGLHLDLLRRSLAETPGPDTRARQERYVGVLESEIKSLETMLGQLLRQIRIGKDAIERFDLVETVRDLHGFLEPHRRKTKIEFPWTAAIEPIAIEGHRGSIRHALVTILIAAIDATRPGQELALGITAADGRAKITISGAAAALVPAILDGTRGAPPKQPALGAEGGLYLARRVLERHGGSVSVRSDAARAATLEIQLPLAGAGNGQVPCP